MFFFAYKKLAQFAVRCALPPRRSESPVFATDNKPSCVLHLLGWFIGSRGFSSLERRPEFWVLHTGSSKQQESSRKTSTSALFIDYTFDCVDHNKLWKNQYLRSQAPYLVLAYYTGGPRGVNIPRSEPQTKGLQSFYTQTGMIKWVRGFEGAG